MGEPGCAPSSSGGQRGQRGYSLIEGTGDRGPGLVVGGGRRENRDKLDRCRQRVAGALAADWLGERWPGRGDPEFRGLGLGGRGSTGHGHEPLLG